MPTVPVTAAGWRIEPPVSVPIASGASKAATAAAEPPPEPPGILVRSQGLCDGPKAECSVEEPIANSSMLVLPRIGMPAARSRVTIVASYGGIQFSRMRDPTVVGIPRVAAMSLTAIGTPARTCSSSPAARRWSTSRAADEGAVRVDVQERVDVAVHGGDPVEVGLRHLDRADLLAGQRVGDRRGALARDVRAH